MIKKQHEMACSKAKNEAMEEAAWEAQEAAKRSSGGASSSTSAADAARPAPPPAPAQVTFKKPLLLSTSETCAIHAKALEERAFLAEAFPLLCDALRMLWGIIKEPGAGRVEEYRQVWVRDCKLHPRMYETGLAQVRARREPGSAA